VRRITLFAAIGVVAVAAIAGIVVAVSGRSNSSASTDPGKVAPTHTSTTQKATTTVKPTTTTTRPYVHQPKAVTLPPVPADGLSWGSSGPVLAAYQQRLKDLHFDPGGVDGQFGEDTAYAVTAVE
jgi:peptidoglycan hydrolase-like protein with peptidoglycan-binding domain